MKCWVHSVAEFALIRAEIRQVLVEGCPLFAELLFVALNEAVNNAFFHGCAESNRFGVEIAITLSSDDICLRVRHQGQGFTPNPISAELPDDFDDHGRGLAIIRRCTDYAEFDHAGQELIMRKSIKLA